MSTPISQSEEQRLEAARSSLTQQTPLTEEEANELVDAIIQQIKFKAEAEKHGGTVFIATSPQHGLTLSLEKRYGDKVIDDIKAVLNTDRNAS